MLPRRALQTTRPQHKMGLAPSNLMGKTEHHWVSLCGMSGSAKHLPRRRPAAKPPMASSTLPALGLRVISASSSEDTF